MNEEDFRVRLTLRHIARERTKGELRGILHTYWNEHGDYEKIKELIETFISDVEGSAVV